MKQRIISGAACVVVLAVVLCLYKTLVLEAALSILSAVAVFELLTANGFKAHKPFLYTAVAVAAALPYTSTYKLVGILVAILFVVLSVILTLKFHSKISFEKISFCILATLFVPFSFLCLAYLRNEYYHGLFYILLCFGGAWFADTGAYFTGRFLGKHKLSPNISPKKTVEGLVGGIVSNVLLLNLLAFVYGKIVGTALVNYVFLSVLAVIVALAGTAGDLIASVIKRQIGIKDYGNLIPGHGGIMDRFDSILFIAPTVYIVTKLVDTIL